MTISFERAAPAVTNSESATSVETSSFTPGAGEALFAFFVPKVTQGSAPTISGGGLTWSLVASRTDAPTRWVYRATVGSSPASMTVTASYGTASKAILHVVGYSGAGDVGATGQAFASGSSREVAFNLTTVEDDSVVVAFGSSDSPGDLSVAGEVVSPYTLRAANATTGGLTASNAAAQTKDRDTSGAGSHEVRMGTAAGGVTPFLANRHIFGIELAVGEDEEPPTSFDWKGVTWNLRTAAESWGPMYNGQWDHANITKNEQSDTVTLKISNPTGNSPYGCEMRSADTGRGYGTYVCTVSRRMDDLYKAVVWGGMFTYDENNPPGFTEFDACEASAWGGGPNEDWDVMWSHVLWFDANEPPGVGSTAESFLATDDVVTTHVMEWEPGKVTFDTYVGPDTSGTLLKHTEITENVHTPANENVRFNMWVFNGDVDPDTTPETTVELLDFAYYPPVTLDPPTGLMAVAVSSTQINVSWNEEPAAHWYELNRQKKDGEDWVDDVVVEDILTTSYEDMDLEESTIYRYRVRSVAEVI